MRNVIWLTLAATTAVLLLPGVAAACDCEPTTTPSRSTEKPTETPSGIPSKADLVASYQPVNIGGQRWLRGVKAAQLKNRRAVEPRPILFLRILGDLDGKT